MVEVAGGERSPTAGEESLGGDYGYNMWTNGGRKPLQKWRQKALEVSAKGEGVSLRPSCSSGSLPLA